MVLFSSSLGAAAAATTATAATTAAAAAAAAAAAPVACMYVLYSVGILASWYSSTGGGCQLLRSGSRPITIEIPFSARTPVCVFLKYEGKS